MQKYIVFLVTILIPPLIYAVEVVDVKTEQKNACAIFHLPNIRPRFPQRGFCVADDGSIWFGSGTSNSRMSHRNGTLRFDEAAPADKQWTFYDYRDGLHNGPVTSIVQDHNGVLWFAGSASQRATITRYDPSQNSKRAWQIYTDIPDVPGKSIGWSAVIDSKNRLWLTTEHTDLEAAKRDSSKGSYGVVCFDGKDWTRYTVADGLVHNRVYDIAEDKNGYLWFATFKGLSRFDGQTWTTYQLPNGPGINKVYRICVMNNGAVWFTHGDAGDGSGGISIYHKNTWQHITLRDGLPVPYVRFIYQAQDSTVWLGTHRHDNVSGLLRYRNRNWLRLYKQDDLPVDNIYGITQARDGTMYLLPGGDKITRLQPDKLPLKTISGTLKDTSGKPVSNRGVHIRIAHDQIRAGCRTDSMGNYHLEIFKEIHAVQTTEIFERVQTRIQNLIGNWQGLLHKRRIIFKLTSLNDTTLTGVLDMPDLSVADISIADISLRHNRLEIDLSKWNARFWAVVDYPNQPGQLVGTWDQRDQFASLTLKKIGEAPNYSRPQTPRPPFPYHTEEVTYLNKKENINLAGSLNYPKTRGPFPAVILISGSGPNDRDQNVLGHKPFLVIADHLARNGFAVLRFDDRGVAQSGGIFDGASIKNFVQDVLAGVQFLMRHPAIDAQQIGLIGHSEGSTVAALAAAQSSDIALTIHIGAPGIPGDRLLIAQKDNILNARNLSSQFINFVLNLDTEIYAIIKADTNHAKIARKLRTRYADAINNIDFFLKEDFKKYKVSTDSSTIEAQFPLLLSTSFRTLLTHDPASTFARLTRPILVLTGSKDLVVSPDENVAAIEAALKKSNHPDYTISILPDLNHMLQKAEKGLPEEYTRIEHTISDTALVTLTKWLAQHTHRE